MKTKNNNTQISNNSITRTVLRLTLVAAFLCSFQLLAQQTPQPALPTDESQDVPSLVNYSGVLTDSIGKPLTGVVGVTFYIYKDQQGGTPLWMETQNVEVGKSGHYSVTLGSTKSHGLPADLFAFGEPRWLNWQVEGQQEQQRVLLVAVPYALKAADAATIGGLPPSAFIRANEARTGTSASASAGSAGTQGVTKKSAQVSPNPPVTGLGTVNYIPLWDSASDIVKSALFQNNAGDVGIGTTLPSAKLDVFGNKLHVYAGDPACGSGWAGIGFGNSGLNCSSYALIGNVGGGTIINSSGTGGSIEFRHNSLFSPADQMFISSAGLVGIGTNSPTHLLEIFAPGARVAQMAMVSSGSDAAFSLKNTAFGGREYWIDSGSGSAGIGAGNFAIWDAAARATRFVVNPSGNVGVGTINPLATLNLNVNGSASADSLLIGNNTTKGLQLRDTGTAVDVESIGRPLYINNTTGQQTYLMGRGVGIGTTSPAATLNLNVEGTATSDTLLIGNNGTKGLLLRDTGADLDIASIGHPLWINNTTGQPTYIMGGDVGIGTAAPSQILTVGKGLGHVLADGYDVYSSQRWKANIKTLDGALAKVERLRGVSYDLKGSGKHEIGVIAEEVGAVVPEIVTWDKNGKDVNGVDYSRLTALLIEAAKEQQSELRREHVQITKVRAEIGREQAVLQEQAAAMQEVRAELRTARETLQKVNAQLAAGRATLVAAR